MIFRKNEDRLPAPHITHPLFLSMFLISLAFLDSFIASISVRLSHRVLLNEKMGRTGKMQWWHHEKDAANLKYLKSKKAYISPVVCLHSDALGRMLKKGKCNYEIMK